MLAVYIITMEKLKTCEDLINVCELPKVLVSRFMRGKKNVSKMVVMLLRPYYVPSTVCIQQVS
jgi:hypothetical protein